MKTKYLAVSILSGALFAVPFSVTADDVKINARDRVSEANRKTHESICKGNHGTITAKTDTSISVDGKMYALTADTRVNKQEEPLLPKTVKTGDTVCFVTEDASDGSKQISKLIAIDKDSDKTRVRDKELDSPSKVEVETPNKKIEVK
ncbi:MAG TPA: hypothetical protein VNT99_14255 [Methylomirabilota bacterium]|nr:hypothetical protein [Methylomirabilota bacterium]